MCIGPGAERQLLWQQSAWVQGVPSCVSSGSSWAAAAPAAPQLPGWDALVRSCIGQATSTLVRTQCRCWRLPQPQSAPSTAPVGTFHSTSPGAHSSTIHPLMPGLPSQPDLPHGRRRLPQRAPVDAREDVPQEVGLKVHLPRLNLHTSGDGVVENTMSGVCMPIIAATFAQLRVQQPSLQPVIGHAVMASPVATLNG